MRKANEIAANMAIYASGGVNEFSQDGVINSWKKYFAKALESYAEEAVKEAEKKIKVSPTGQIFNCTHGNWELERFELQEQVKAVRKEALEEAAKVAEEGRFLVSDSPEAIFGHAVGKAIRALSERKP